MTSKCVCVHCVCVRVCFQKRAKQGVTNTLALPINKMLYIYLLRRHSQHQKMSMLYIYFLCPHSQHQKMSMFYICLLCRHSQRQKNVDVVLLLIVSTLSTPKKTIDVVHLLIVSTLSTPKNICSNLNSLNTFTKETSSNKVKLPKVGSNAIVPVPVKAEA